MDHCKLFSVVLIYFPFKQIFDKSLTIQCSRYTMHLTKKWPDYVFHRVPRQMYNIRTILIVLNNILRDDNHV